MGQRGDDNAQLYPTALSTPAGVESAQEVALGGRFSCARLASGRVKCWGEPYAGGLGNGASYSRTSPEEVPELRGVSSISLGGFSGCAIVGAQTLCWGLNGDGALANPDYRNRGAPTASPSLTSLVALAPGPSVGHACGIKSTGELSCWGDNFNMQLGVAAPAGPSAIPQVPLNVPPPVLAAAVGQKHSCAVASNGDLWCWGANDYFQLGFGTFGTHPPARVTALTNPQARVVAGSAYTCSLDISGMVNCWGLYTLGALAGGGGQGEVPAPVSTLPATVRELSGGGGHVCAIDMNDLLYCWGSNDSGQLGVVSSTTVIAQSVMPGTRFLSVAAGSHHTCAVTKLTGQVYCWGKNAAGQLGRTPVSQGSSLSPGLVPSLTGIQKVFAGGSTSCAVDLDQRAYCWGDAQLGASGVLTGRSLEQWNPTLVVSPQPAGGQAL